MRACFVRNVWLRPYPAPLLIASLTCLSALMTWPSGQVRAEDKRAAALNWVRLTGAETCIDAPTLARRVEERLAHAVFPAPAQASLIVEGRAEKTAQGFAATLRIFDPEGVALGSRDLSSTKPDCAELSETVVLVLAVMIDPDGALAIPRAAPEKPAKPEPPALTPPKAAAQPVQAKGRDVSAFARLELGSLPAPAFGAGAAVLVSYAPQLTFRTEGAAFMEEKATQVGDPSRGANFGLLYATFEYCPLYFARKQVGVVVCAGAAAGAMISRSFGLDPRENDQVDPVLNGIARLRFDVRLRGPFRAIVGAGIGTPFIRTLYEITRLDGSTEALFESDFLNANVDLGVTAQF